MSENDSTSQTGGEYPLPPATFEFFVLSLKMQTEMYLGMSPFSAGGEGEKPETDLRAARHTIDLLAMIQEKTKGNLSLEEQRLLENSLTELRFRYIAAMEESRKTTAAAAPKADGN